MITELTKEQQDKIPEYVDKWIKIGLATDGLNEEKSLAALKRAYEQVDLEFPDKHEVYDSPYAAIEAMKSKYDVDVTPNDFVYGAHEAPWLSFYDYFGQVCGLDVCNDLEPFIDLANHCGWALLFDELVVLTYKPTEIKWDEENRTHCEDDYAIKFRDGTGVCIWHGLRIPEEWIFDKSTITTDVALHWDNVEQRRAACEILGWAQVLKNLNAKVIDEDPDPSIGTLLEADLPDIGTERFLVARDPNVGKDVGLPVPNDVNTALEANSWTYGIEKFEFKPDFRV